jgi:hypothetical protein
MRLHPSPFFSFTVVLTRTCPDSRSAVKYGRAASRRFSPAPLMRIAEHMQLIFSLYARTRLSHSASLHSSLKTAPSRARTYLCSVAPSTCTVSGVTASICTGSRPACRTYSRDMGSQYYAPRAWHRGGYRDSFSGSCVRLHLFVYPHPSPNSFQPLFHQIRVVPMYSPRECVDVRLALRRTPLA